jgi:ParB-like chromosome segregation protein Spo0J
MNRRVRLACDANVRTIEVSSILPMRKISKGTKSTLKYRQIASSMREIGIIETIVVHPQNGEQGHDMLLDGHIRLEILKEMGDQIVDCLVAIDDEAFTYNHKVNRLTAIQEHFMIMKVIKNGVSEHDIAAALDVDVAKIRRKRDLLVGICPEAVELLKGKRANAETFAQLRKAKPMRQIEMAELMCASHNFSVSYAKCLVAATPAEQLIDQENPKNVDGLSAVEMARMEREMESLSKGFKQIEETHGSNVLNLVIVVGYLKKLLDNARVVRYLAQNYREILTEFQKIVESRGLEDAPNAE